MGTMDIEDRIFELMDEMALGREIVAAIVDERGIDRDTAWDLYIKVRNERGSPNLVALVS